MRQEDPVATTTETDAMRRAVALSARALGATSPNPVVGCVILDADGAVAGEGWHQRAGGPHAEVHALFAAGERARGGTALVTLEPCNHTGRTGPCAQALIEAGVARVVYAVADPNRAASGGADTLRAAGVDVDGRPAGGGGRGGQRRLADLGAARPPVRALEVRRHARRPDRRRRRQQPLDHLRAEPAPTCTGCAPRPTPSWSAPAPCARTTRTWPYAASTASPSRCGWSSTRGPVRTAGARVLDDAAPTLIAVGKDADTSHLPGVDVVRLPYARPGSGLDVTALLAELYGRGVRSVLLEGGPTLAGAFVAAGAVDAVTGYLAPALLGAGPAALADAGITTIAQALRLDVTDVARLGPDLRVTAVPAVPTAPQES